MAIVFKKPVIKVFRPEPYKTMLERCCRMTAVCRNWNMPDADYNSIESMENYVRIHRDKLQGNIMEFGDFCVLLRVPHQHMTEIRMHRMASMMSSSIRSDPQEPLDHYLPPHFTNLKNDVFYTVENGKVMADGTEVHVSPDEFDFVHALYVMDGLYTRTGQGRHKYLVGMRHAQMAVKTNIRQWHFICNVRSGAITDRADQTSRNTFGPLLKWFKENYPVFFEDIRTVPYNYDVEFEVIP